MSTTVIGVRHHSPSCARLVAATVEALRPAHVLIEGPADMNDRLDELMLGHDLPVAIYTSYRDDERVHGSWTPFCEYSPEWVALTVGRRCGAEVRFIDLPAWHPALAGLENRYADAERRCADVMDRLCRGLAVDNVDTLWDHLFEVPPGDDLAERLSLYFDLIRGESAASAADAEREAYMASWIRAAVARAGDRPVVVVTGGFHRPPLVRSLAGGGAGGDGSWPEVPRFPPGAVGGSYLIPYSFKRLDAFDGYQSGLPSPGYYQRLWEGGLEDAGAGLMEMVVTRLRRRGQPVSTADLIAARAMAGGLARLRGHPHPARTDVLDGLVASLVTDPLDVRLPWTDRGQLRAGTDPVVVEMVAALSGDRVGRLHPDTPLPPLVHTATADLERCGRGPVVLDLTDAAGLERSRILHRLRVLGIPGVTRDSGPTTGAEPVLDEHWTISESDLRLPALIEAGGYGATLAEAAGAALDERLAAVGGDVGRLALLFFDAVVCGVGELPARLLERVGSAIATGREMGPIGRALAVVLGLWRHDRVFGVAGHPALGAVITTSVERLLWLAEGVRGGPAPADLERLAALVAARDALRHAGPAFGIDRDAALAVMGRLTDDAAAPPDLRGAALGFAWSLGAPATDPVRVARRVATPGIIGDWLAGLFALAREEVMTADALTSPPAGPSGPPPLLTLLDELVGAMTEHDFLVALPALRQAFTFFPPREREAIAHGLLARRGLRGSARALLRTTAAPELIAEAGALEARVDEVLLREGLLRDPPLRDDGPLREGTP